MRIISETEFYDALKERLRGVSVGAVTGPGRSGAIASVYASHILGVPFLPFGTPCPADLGPLLIVDTARKSGRTLQKARLLYRQSDHVVAWVFDEPPRVKFWYEGNVRS
jgi:adenine/guanine phosphoribosyltransferase-like PRPP-binding protein